MEAERTDQPPLPPGEGPGVRESRTRRRHPPPPDLSRPPFGTALELLEDWRNAQGHLFDETLPLLSRLLALGTAAHLSFRAGDFEVQSRAGALLVRHLPGPRAPFDPATGGKGWGLEGKADHVQSLANGPELRRPAGEQKPKQAAAHLVLRARKALLCLATRIRYERGFACHSERSEESLGLRKPKGPFAEPQGDREPPSPNGAPGHTLEDRANSIALWIRDTFEPRHFQERLVFLGIAAPLAELLAGNDAERLRSAQRILSLTAPFARRKFIRYTRDKPDEPSEDLDPWPAVLANLAKMNEGAAEGPPPIQTTAPT